MSELLLSISPEDRARISAAVAKAEMRSSGEIVTIAAPQSDAYHDVGLHYAIGAMLALVALVAAYPADIAGWADRLFLGWAHDVSPRAHMTMLLVAMIVLFLAVRFALAWMPLRLMLTPPATKTRRVRRLAIAHFRASAQGRTRNKTGILLYLSLAEHRAEIVADAEIVAHVAPERWGDAMALLVHHLKRGDAGTGIIEAVNAIGAVLAEHLPHIADNPNELPDGLIEL